MGVLVPGEQVAQERLAQPEVIGPGQPIGLGEELVESIVGGDAPRGVLACSLQLHAGGLVLQLVPFPLVVLLQEVPVADPADLGRESEIARQQMSVPPKETIPVVFIGQHAAPPAAQVVEAIVLDAPEVEQARRGTANPEKIVAAVGERGPVAEPAVAEVVEADVPIGPLGLVADAQQLIAVPIGQHLGAEHAVVLDPRTANVERRVLQVGSQKGPIEYRKLAQVEQVVPSGGQSPMFNQRFAGYRIDQRCAAPRIEQRPLIVFHVRIGRLNAIAGTPHAAGGDERVSRRKPIPAGLLENLALDPQHPFIVGHGREHLRVEHDADAIIHVVIHPLGIGHPLPFPEDDVALHVDLQGDLVAERPLSGEIRLLDAAGPEHEPIGGNVDHGDLDRTYPRTGQPFHDQVDALVHHTHPLVGLRVAAPLKLDRDATAGVDGDPAPSRRRETGGRRGGELGVLGRADLAVAVGQGIGQQTACRLSRFLRSENCTVLPRKTEAVSRRLQAVLCRRRVAPKSSEHRDDRKCYHRQSRRTAGGGARQKRRTP